MKLLFLDIDGVLNGHQILKSAGCCGIDPRCVRHLNRVLHATDCKIVISSAWRYMISQGSMRLDGFWHMMRTHGLSNRGKGNPFIGITRNDLDVGKDERGQQIREWLKNWKQQGGERIQKYVAVDDCDLGITSARIPVVFTNGKVGLTRAKASELIRSFQ